MNGSALVLSPDDIAKGWTLRMLAAARGMYRRGDRSAIVLDGNRRYETAKSRARRSAMIYATSRPVALDDVMHLLACGETFETVAARLGVQEDSILTAARRHGTPEQHERLLRASRDMREIRVSLRIAS